MNDSPPALLAEIVRTLTQMKKEGNITKEDLTWMIDNLKSLINMERSSNYEH